MKTIGTAPKDQYTLIVQLMMDLDILWSILWLNWPGWNLIWMTEVTSFNPDCWWLQCTTQTITVIMQKLTRWCAIRYHGIEILHVICQRMIWSIKVNHHIDKHHKSHNVDCIIPYLCHVGSLWQYNAKPAWKSETMAVLKLPIMYFIAKNQKISCQVAI